MHGKHLQICNVVDKKMAMKGPTGGRRQDHNSFTFASELLGVKALLKDCMKKLRCKVTLIARVKEYEVY